MDNNVAIRVNKLSKMYKLYPKVGDVFWEALLRKKRYSEGWALRDVSFEVKRGEVVGIIGPNGAGKSTLLKILSGTLDKTSGDFEINGNLTAILEMGTGFHMEATGRENIILGGMCIGFPKEEMERKTESIIEFSELGSFIDQPVKTYSSGMLGRLAFSVAMSVNPQILILDEALAAGDAYFVQKCLGRIYEICSSGVTVLFVSHSVGLVAELCHWALWLNEGETVLSGEADKVSLAYEYDTWKRLGKEKETFSQEKKEEIANIVEIGHYQLGTQEVEITKVELLGEEGGDKDKFTQGERMRIRIYWKGHAEGADIHPAIRLETEAGAIIMADRSVEEGFFIDKLDGEGVLEADFGLVLLGAGNYFITAAISRGRAKSEEDMITFLRRCRKFSVQRRHKGEFDCVFELPVQWRNVLA